METMLRPRSSSRRIGLIRAVSVDRLILDTQSRRTRSRTTPIADVEKGPPALVKFDREKGIKLRQNYNREARRLSRRSAANAHAKKCHRMKKSLRTVRSRV